VSLCGLVLLLEPWTARAAGNWTGAALGAASAVFYAASVMFGKGLQRWFSVSEVLAFHMAAALPMMWLFVPAGGFAVGLPAYAVLIAGGLIGGVLANVIFLRGLQRVPAQQASVLTLIEPVIAVFTGAVVWAEVPGPMSLAGAGLVLGGAWLVIRPRDPGSP
jgi:drug/metabolite transporter (DMT)-like permease